MREDGERLLTLDEDFPDQREYTTVVAYGGTGVPVPVLLRHPEPGTEPRSSPKVIVFVGADPYVIPNPDPTPGSVGFQPALGYTEFFAGKMPALPA